MAQRGDGSGGRRGKKIDRPMVRRSKTERVTYGDESETVKMAVPDQLLNPEAGETADDLAPVDLHELLGIAKPGAEAAVETAVMELPPELIARYEERLRREQAKPPAKKGGWAAALAEGKGDEED